MDKLLERRVCLELQIVQGFEQSFCQDGGWRNFIGEGFQREKKVFCFIMFIVENEILVCVFLLIRGGMEKVNNIWVFMVLEINFE